MSVRSRSSPPEVRRPTLGDGLPRPRRSEHQVSAGLQDDRREPSRLNGPDCVKTRWRRLGLAEGRWGMPDLPRAALLVCPEHRETFIGSSSRVNPV